MTAISASLQPNDSNVSAQSVLATPVSGTGPATAPSRRSIWAGRILSGLAVSFLAFDAAIHVFPLMPLGDAANQLGVPAELLQPIGWLEVACLVAYLIPRTSVLGAVLWTGYLGGAIAIHMRVGNPLFTHTLFPIYVAALLWGGLWLRDRRVRALTARASER